MKNIIYSFAIISFLIFSCGTPNNTVVKNNDQKEEPVRIVNDSLEYEILIFDIGFNNYLNNIARPMGFYEQSFLEARNIVYVTEWNIRAMNPTRFNPNIYENVIDYQPHINYGMEVNYKLYNYFQFAQRKYNMRLASFRVQ